MNYHHGKGTRSIFYERQRRAVHLDYGRRRPEFPFFLGYADEHGRQKARSFNFSYRCSRVGWPGAPRWNRPAPRRYAADIIVKFVWAWTRRTTYLAVQARQPRLPGHGRTHCAPEPNPLFVMEEHTRWKKSASTPSTCWGFEEAAMNILKSLALCAVVVSGAARPEKT